MYRNSVLDLLGNAVASASIEVRQVGTNTKITETIYDAAGVAVANPLSADTTGEFEVWLDNPKRVDLYITGTGFATETQTVDVQPSADDVASKKLANTWEATQTFGAPGAIGGTQWNSSAQGLLDISSVNGLNGVALQLLALGVGKSANLMLVPEATGNQSQILLYGKSGDDYNRIGLNNTTGNEFVIDSTYNGVGVARPIIFQMGGSVSNAIDGEVAIWLRSDASIDLNGAEYSRQGKTWGTLRTRIADRQNSGDSRLIIDTRTGTPADNVADSSSIELRRGGADKWNVGLNFTGGGVDALDFTDRTNGSRLAMQLRQQVNDGGTAMFLLRRVGAAYSTVEVTMGAADSGGSGFKVLRVPN